MGMTFNFEMYGQPEDDEDFLRRMRLAVYSPMPNPPIKDGFEGIRTIEGNFTFSPGKFRRILKYIWHCQMPNNWLRRHGIPMRRGKENRL